MSERLLHREWRDEAATTQYPFADSASLVNSEGVFVPDSLLLDASLHPVGGTRRMYLSKVIATGESAQLFIGDENTDELASATIDLLQPPDIVKLVDSLGRSAGILVSSATRLSTFQSWEGENEFSVEETEFTARVCIPVPNIGFQGFVLEDGSIFTDDIWIVGEDGVVVRRETFQEQADGYSGEVVTQEVIRIDVVGDPMFRRRLCGQLFETPQLLKTLTFKHGCERIVCGPDSLGDLKVTAGSQDAPDTVLRIRSVPEGLIVEAVGETIGERRL